MSGIMKTCVVKFIRKGVSVSHTYVEYARNTSNETAPTSGWSTTPPVYQDGYYIWERIQTVYSDGTSEYSVPVCLTGGRGIVSVTEYYLATSASSGVTRNTSGWTTGVQTVTSAKKYLWNYEKVTYSDDSVTYTTPIVIGVYGEKGDTGVSISSITEYYLATSASTGVTRSTSGWTTSVQTITATKKYLWNYEKVTFTDNSTSYTEPAIIGVYGDKGDKGDTGDTGDKGDKGDKGNKGDTGDSAPVAFASPDKIVFPCGNGGAVKTATTKSVIFSLKVGTNTATVTSVTSGTKPTGITVTGQADNAVTITASTSATAVGMASGVTFTVNGTYGGKSYSATITVALIGSIEGSKGYTGPSLRVQDWNKCTTNGTVNYQFYQGADGEKYKDVVLYNGYYYSCIMTHSNKSYVPNPNNQSSYWKLGDKVELIATNILLANYSLIKNLGAEAIQMYASGHSGDANYLLFQAKDGTVTCNTGNFYNVNVTGKVTAKLFYSPTKQLSVENFTNGVYNINPSSDPAHTFVLDHPIVNETDGGSLAISLPSATTYDGLELQFLEIRRTRSVIASVTLLGSITNGGTLFSNISSGYLKLNKFTVLKAMAGRWYVIQEELST